MSSMDAQGLFSKGVEALEANNTPAALTLFEKAFNLDPTPAATSYLAFCIAKERGQINRAISLCQEALAIEPGNYVHYLNLGKIYVLNGNKTLAIDTLRKCLDQEPNERIVAELAKLGTRKPPVFSFLPRQHPLNKYIGLLLSRLGLR